MKAYINKREKIIVASIFIILIIVFGKIACDDLYGLVGDTAIFSQATEKILDTGLPVSNIFANTQDYIDRSIAQVPVDERLGNIKYFTSPIQQSRNMLGFHFYLILYLLAPFCKIFSGEIILTIAQVISYIGCIAFVYILLRENKVSILLSTVICILISCHPGLSLAILGPFYPDRLFMVLGMYLCWTCCKEKFDIVQFLIASILCVFTGERAALYGGMFVLAYTFFYWNIATEKRIVRLVTGTIMLGYSIVVTKMFLSNIYYNESPINLKNIIMLFEDNNFVKRILLFLIINVLLFGVIAFFDWRATCIGFAAMLPNIITNIGGAEKLGWSLHYHTYYFVILIWAITMGVISFNKKYADKQVFGKLMFGEIGIVTISGLIVIINLINPYDYLNINFSFNNIKNNIVYTTLGSATNLYIHGLDKVIKNDRIEIDRIIDKNASVSTIETCMPILYKNRDVHLFPMGIETSDYAVVTYYEKNKEIVFGGAITYYGASETERFNNVIFKRMKNEYGYDFENAKLIPSLGIAIIQRKS